MKYKDNKRVLVPKKRYKKNIYIKIRMILGDLIFNLLIILNENIFDADYNMELYTTDLNENSVRTIIFDDISDFIIYNYTESLNNNSLNCLDLSKDNEDFSNVNPLYPGYETCGDDCCCGGSCNCCGHQNPGDLPEGKSLSKFETLQSDVPVSWGLYFQDGASPSVEGIVDLHNRIMFYLIVILFGVSWVLFSIMYNFNKSNNKLVYRYLNHGTLIELVWTVGPALVLVAIAFPSFKLLYLMDEVIDPAMTVKVTGQFGQIL